MAWCQSIGLNQEVLGSQGTLTLSYPSARHINSTKYQLLIIPRKQWLHPKMTENLLMWKIASESLVLKQCNEATTVYSPSSRNCISQNLTQEKYNYATILHSKCLKMCHKKKENRLRNKNLMPKNNFEEGFLQLVKMSAREVTIFPEKNLDCYFSFKMLQTKIKLYCMHSWAPNY